MALELAVLLALAVIGPGVFAVFEVETPAWRKVLKWSFLSGLTLWLYTFIGHWSLMVPGFGLVAGTTFHYWWCRKNGIDPLRATPRKRYYELRGWARPES